MKHLYNGGKVEKGIRDGTMWNHNLQLNLFLYHCTPFRPSNVYFWPHNTRNPRLVLSPSPLPPHPHPTHTHLSETRPTKSFSLQASSVQTCIPRLKLNEECSLGSVQTMAKRVPGENNMLAAMSVHVLLRLQDVTSVDTRVLTWIWPTRDSSHCSAWGWWWAKEELWS